MSELIALLDGREVATVRQARGRLNLDYADAWCNAPGAYPLSLSMPLGGGRSIAHGAIEPFPLGAAAGQSEFVDPDTVGAALSRVGAQARSR